MSNIAQCKASFCILSKAVWSLFCRIFTFTTTEHVMCGSAKIFASICSDRAWSENASTTAGSLSSIKLFVPTGLGNPTSNYSRAQCAGLVTAPVPLSIVNVLCKDTCEWFESNNEFPFILQIENSLTFSLIAFIASLSRLLRAGPNFSMSNTYSLPPCFIFLEF